MIRFIDLTQAYWTYGGDPCCAFLSTVNDRFVADDLDGCHVFSSVDDVPTELREYIPEGFFDSCPVPE